MQTIAQIKRIMVIKRLLLALAVPGVILTGISVYLIYSALQNGTLSIQVSPLGTTAPTAEVPAPKVVQPNSFDVPATQYYTDTNLRVRKGQTVTLWAEGQVTASVSSSDGAHRWVGANGWSQEPGFNAGWRGLSRAAFMSLVARITKGTPPMNDEGWQFIGSSGQITATEDGTLYLAVNEKFVDTGGNLRPEWSYDNDGMFKVQVKVK
jgi:hypothetical protein